MSRFRAMLCWMSFVLVARASAAAAQNLLANAEFEDAVGAAGWSVGTGSGGFEADVDANGCAASGSLAADSVVVGELQIARLFTCAPLSTFGNLRAEVLYRQFGGFGLGVEIAFYDAPGCDAADFISSSGTYGHAPSTTWALATHSAVAPVQAQSAILQTWSSGPVDSVFVVNVDRAWLGFSTPIDWDDFEANATCRWDAVQTLTE